MNYKHLTQEERYQIQSLKQEGVSTTGIAAELGRSRSTITRELQRNAGPRGGYAASTAHTQARTRQCARRNARQISPQHWSHANVYLRLYLSPQQVSGRLKLEHGIGISTETLYEHVYRDKAQGGDLVSYLQWMGEPAQNTRVRVGVWVLLFLGVFTFFTWRLNAAYWKDVK